MSEVIEARNIKLNVEASDWRDSMIKSGQLLVDSEYITKDYIDLDDQMCGRKRTIHCYHSRTCTITFKTRCQC